MFGLTKKLGQELGKTRQKGLFSDISEKNIGFCRLFGLSIAPYWATRTVLARNPARNSGPKPKKAQTNAGPISIF